MSEFCSKEVELKFATNAQSCVSRGGLPLEFDYIHA